MNENKNQNDQEIKAQPLETENQRQISTPTTQNKPFPAKVVAIVSSAIAVVAVSAVAIIAILGGGKSDAPHTHSFGEWSIAKEVTCETNGIKERFCNCGEKQTEDIYSTGHSFGAWTVVEEATCAAEGSKKHECECGKSEILMINKLNTHIEVLDSAVEPSCIKTGLTEGAHCSVCNKVLVEQNEIPVLAHTYTDEYDASCNVCGFERNPDCRHDNTVTIPGKAATCTETGLTDGKKCAQCGENVVAQIVVKAKGHTKGMWITDKPATCTAEGKKHQECSVCHATVDESKISPLGHTESGWITREAPTCTVKGSRYKECTVCHEMIISEPINALGHSGGEWVYDKEPTCTANGTRHKICKVCNTAFGSESVSAKGHNYKNYICINCDGVQPGVTLIYDVEDLLNVKNNLNGNYILMNDIDCTDVIVPPIGVDESRAFTGVFDGRGFTISNLVASNARYIGLFGYSSGQIKNLNLSNLNYDITSSSYDVITVGGIVGYNSGTVEKCAVIDGFIYVSSDFEREGGLICGRSSGNIKNCYATGNVTITQPNLGYAWARAGGIVAYNTGNIFNCFVDATVYAKGYYSSSWSYLAHGDAALICAANKGNGTVENCFVLGNVTYANSSSGDICGENDNTSVVKNCYKGEGVIICKDVWSFYEKSTVTSLSAMSNKTFYSINLSWDSDIWNFNNVNLANKVYPKLIQN